MLSFRAFGLLATVAALFGAGSGCARYADAAGVVIDPVEAAKTVVVNVDNVNSSPMELRAIMSGRSQFVGSVAGNDTTSVLLDPTMFPTGFLYLAAIPSDGRGRAIVGPLSASKGDKIRLTIQPELGMSNAIVIR